jgi:hypothetical protein
MRSDSGKQALLWAAILMAIGIVALIDVYADLSPWVWVALLAVAGAGAFVVYLTDRSNWLLLIPAYVMLAVALLVTFSMTGVLRHDATAVFVLIAIALPFLVVFLRNRNQWWWLIPGYVLAAVALMIGLQAAGVLSDALTGPYVLFAIAIPFFVLFARRPRRWWPLIPAGVLTIVALSLLVAEDAGGYIGPLILIGVGGAIGARLLMRRRGPDQAGSEVVDG